MRLNDLPVSTHVNDRRPTRANAGKYIRNGIRAEEGYAPLPGNNMSEGDPNINRRMNRMGLPGLDGRVRRINRMDTVPYASPDPYEPNSRVGTGTRGSVPNR